MHGADVQRRKPRVGWEAEEFEARKARVLALVAAGEESSVVRERLGITEAEWEGTYRKVVWRAGLGQAGLPAVKEGEDMAKGKQEAAPVPAANDDVPKVRMVGLARVPTGHVVVEAEVPATQVRNLNPGQEGRPLSLAAAVLRLRVRFGEMVREAVARRPA